MLPPLPTEVLEVVVDASRDDRATVAACGLAGRQFLLRSRMYLFAEISLGSPRASTRPDKTSMHTLYPSVPTRCDLFSELLARNPNLVRCVMALELSEGGPGNTTYWISQSTTLVQLARRLANLRIFTLREAQASEWSPALIQTMHLCLHAPSIESVELVGLRVTELPSLFAIFSATRLRTTLQSLKLSDFIVPLDVSSSKPMAQNELRRMGVHTLDISSSQALDDQHRIIELLSQTPPLIDLSRLRHLRLSAADLLLATRWIQLRADSLVQLDLELRHDWLALSASEEDIVLDRLSTLRFEITARGAMSAALRTLRMLRALLLTDILFSSLDANFHVAEDDGFQWAALDSLISRQYFPSLTTVHFTTPSGQPPLREWMPNLNKSGMLFLNPLPTV
ncbi:hypothetical protein C8R45DRAFT_987385 [Mycena sanguinolenta]|nr:hypothetical protein C8R45DRAFT_987385 [Mycena sanguinolenta]